MVQDVRIKFSEDVGDLPFEELDRSGIIMTFLNLLRKDFSKHEDIQHNILWTFINYTYGGEEIIRKIIGQGLLDNIIHLLDEPREKTYDQVIGILSNISGESIALRNDLFAWKGFETIVCKNSSYFRDNFNINKNLAWLLSNCLRGSPYPSYEQSQLLIHKLEDILKRYDDMEIELEGVWGAYYFIDQQDQKSFRNGFILNSHFNDKLRDWVCAKDIRIHKPAIRIIGVLSSDSNEVIDTFFDFEIVQVSFPKFLNIFLNFVDELHANYCLELAI